MAMYSLKTSMHAIVILPKDFEYLADQFEGFIFDGIIIEEDMLWANKAKWRGLEQKNWLT